MNCSRNSRSLALAGQTRFGYVAGLQEFVLVASSIGGLDQRQSDKQRLAVSIPAFERVGDHLDRLAAAVTMSIANSLKKPCIRSSGAMWVS